MPAKSLPCFYSYAALLIPITFCHTSIVNSEHRYHDHQHHRYRHRHYIAMAQLSVADLQETPSIYESTWNIGDVLVGEDAARLLMEASLFGDEI